MRLRVRPSGLPHGDTGCRPPDDLPSPPPSGWSTGFMATPRVWGRTPFQRLRPALPSLISSCSELPTTPRVARQSIGHAAHLGGGQPQRREAAVLGDELDAHPGAPRHLAAAAGAQLDVVDDRAGRDVAHRQGVAHADVRAVARTGPRRPTPRPCGREDVALLAVERSAAARSGRCGWGRTRCGRPWPARRPCSGGSRRSGTAACGRRRGAARSCGPRRCARRSWAWPRAGCARASSA